MASLKSEWIVGIVTTTIMRATVMYSAGDVRIENVPDPKIIEPTDAVIASRERAFAGAICGHIKKWSAATPVA
jgi:hypothetical protein